MMDQWYVVKTKNCQEEKAKINLNNQNLITYLPQKNYQTKQEILFPGYLFILLNQVSQN